MARKVVVAGMTSKKGGKASKELSRDDQKKRSLRQGKSILSALGASSRDAMPADLRIAVKRDQARREKPRLRSKNGLIAPTSARDADDGYTRFTDPTPGAGF